MGFLYSISLKLLNPAALSVLLLLAAAGFRKRKAVSRVCFWLAVTTLLVCGNGWVVGSMVKHLEWQYLPPNPVPQADCIVILGGCLDSQIPPRSTIEVTEAGDRVLYGWHLYRQGRAPLVICTGGVSAGGVALRPAAEDMADFLEHLGMPRNAILTETNSSTTREHPVNLGPVFRDRGLKRVLLVTSALHMPRSVAVFKRGCPEIEFIAAPTDFRTTEGIPKPWYYRFNSFVPGPGNLLAFSNAAHEYLGMLYYRMRGWM